MGEVSKINRTLAYNLGRHNQFSSRAPKTVKVRTETISFLAWALSLGFSPRKDKRTFLFGSF